MTFITYKNAVNASSALWELPHPGLWCFILMCWSGAAACCSRASIWPWAPSCLYPCQTLGMLDSGPGPQPSALLAYRPLIPPPASAGRERSVTSIAAFQCLMWCWYPRCVAGNKSYLGLEWFRERRRSRYVVEWNKKLKCHFLPVLKFLKPSACFWWSGKGWKQIWS